MAKYTKQNFYNGQVLGAEHLASMEDAIIEAQEGVEESSKKGHTHDERYYTEAEVDSRLAKKSDTSHTHDQRYYTKTETDSKLASKSEASHNHDARYYTETEVDNLLKNKSSMGHEHDDRYYTEAEIDAMLSGIAVSGHNHDNRYYKQEEVNDLLEGLAGIATNYVTTANFNDLWTKRKVSVWYVNQSSGLPFSNQPHNTNLYLLSMSYNDTDCVQVAFTRGTNGVISTRRISSDGSWSAWRHHYAAEYDSNSKTLNFII